MNEYGFSKVSTHNPSHNGVGARAEDDGEIDLFELLRTLWRGKYVILLMTILSVVLAVYYSFSVAVPIYNANTVVALESRQEQVVDLESVVTGLSGDQSTINTEIEVMRSRGLIEKLVAQLDLTSDPEFNRSLRPKPSFSIGQAVDLIRGAMGAEPSKDRVLTDDAVLDRTVDEVLKALSVSNVRQSFVFRISARSQSAEKSALIANTLAELYILEQVDVKFAATEKATEWLAERVTELQVELEAAEENLKAFGTSTDLISPEALAALNRQLKELRDRQSDAQSQIALSEARQKTMAEAFEAGDFKRVVDLSSDPTLRVTLNRIEAGDSDAEETFRTRYGQVTERGEAATQRLAAQRDALGRSISEVEQQISIQSTELVELQQLQREAEASRLIYEHFLSRLKETSVQQGIQQADSRVISRAVVPSNPSEPRKSMILAASLILGSILGSAIVLGREMTKTTFRTPEQLEAKTGRAVLGQVPLIPMGRRRKVIDYIHSKPNSAAAEAVRDLRTSVLMSNLDHQPKVIMVTSSVPGESKTTTSIALAQNLSGLGKRVLLIEGDIRRRTFGEYFDTAGRKGVLSVLSGEVSLEEALLRDDKLGADVLLGERSTMNAADVFSSTRFGDFLQEMREAYDFVVIDTPPVLVVPDARIIGRSVDAVLYTVKWDQTSHRMVLSGLRSFESVNVRVTGLVLTQINHKALKKYGYGSEYAAYGSYYNN